MSWTVILAIGTFDEHGDGDRGVDGGQSRLGLRMRCLKVLRTDADVGRAVIMSLADVEAKREKAKLEQRMA